MDFRENFPVNKSAHRALRIEKQETSDLSASL